MKILMIAPEPFFEPRGTPVSVYQRLQALTALGHKVDLVTYHVGQDVSLPGLHIYRSLHLPFIRAVKVGPSWLKPFLDFLVFVRALLLLFRGRYDAIHSHEEAAFFSIFLSYFFQVPHVYDMHSSLPAQFENFNFGNWWPVIKIFKLFERWTLFTCDVVITIGEDLADWVEQVNPLARQITIENLPLNVVTDGSSPEKAVYRNGFSSNAGAQSLVYTGTLEPYQGIELLLQSAELVVAGNSNAYFTLVGGRPDQIEYLQRQIQQTNLQDHVRFVGMVSPDEANGYVEAADILLSPRVHGTSIPLKVYSYLYSGKPTIATNINAHTQILNNEIAYLVEPTKEGLADGILTLLADGDMRAMIGYQARKYALSKYNFEEYKAKLDHVYSRMLDPKHPTNNIVRVRDY